MINGHLEQFLDTGWYTEATLFFNGYIYWCEAQFDEETKLICFFVDKWSAENEDNTYYHSILEADGTIQWNRVLEIKDKDIDLIKKIFLESPIFEGKTFWQVEKKLIWLEEGGSVIRSKKQNGSDF